jgi:CsoR family transcriptional regulator, copper-sensing transcriptional repressor
MLSTKTSFVATGYPLCYGLGMPISDDSKEKLKLRLAKAMGHLNAVHQMVDRKKYCIDVLHQLKAVQSALDKVAEEILKQHLETCVVEAVRNQDEQRVIDELIQVFRKAPELDLSQRELGGAASESGCCH